MTDKTPSLDEAVQKIIISSAVMSDYASSKRVMTDGIKALVHTYAAEVLEELKGYAIPMQTKMTMGKSVERLAVLAEGDKRGTVDCAIQAQREATNQPQIGGESK